MLILMQIDAAEILFTDIAADIKKTIWEDRNFKNGNKTLDKNKIKYSIYISDDDINNNNDNNNKESLRKRKIKRMNMNTPANKKLKFNVETFESSRKERLKDVFIADMLNQKYLEKDWIELTKSYYNG